MNPITGETAAVVLSPTGIPADPPLTAHGVDQANELATHLMAFEPPIDAVYSSPYYRCLQTISPFVTRRNESSGAGAPLAIQTERGLSEFFGAAPFDHPVPAEIPFLKGLFPDIDETHRSRVVPSRKGEAIEALYHRVKSAVEAIVEECDAKGHRTVILCSHAAVVIALGRVLTGDIPATVDVQDFGAFTCGLSKFRRSGADSKVDSHPKSDAGGPSVARGKGDGSSQARNSSSGDRTGNWVCEANSDCSFLSGGEERGWYVPQPHHQQHQHPLVPVPISYPSPAPPSPSPSPPPHLCTLVNAQARPDHLHPRRAFSGDEAFTFGDAPPEVPGRPDGAAAALGPGQAGSPKL